MLIVALAAPSSAVAAVDALAGESGCLWKGFSADLVAPDGCASGEVTNYEAIVAAPEGRDVYVADDEGLLRRYARNAATGELTTAAGDCWSDQPLGSCSQLLGIAYPTALALSPDGLHLYVGNGDGIVAVLRRDTATGTLTQSGPPDACYGPRFSEPTCSFARIAADWITNLEVTPDGTGVLASIDDQSLAVFVRDPLTGRLTQPPGRAACIGTWGTDSEGNSCHRPLEHLWTYLDTATSQDGTNVYVATDDELLHFSRDAASGVLALQTCRSYWAHDGCIATSAATRWESISIALSPDGRTLYSAGWDEVLVFDVDPVTGALTQLAGSAGCLQREDRHIDAACAWLRGYDAGQSIEVAPDGATVYVVTYYGSLIVFDRNAVTGALTQRSGRAGCITADPRPSMSSCLVTGEASASWRLAISPDSANVYALASDDALVSFGSPAASCRDIVVAERTNVAAFDVRGKCVGLDPDLRVIELVGAPAHGTVTVSDGVFHVTPDPAWTGSDAFTYRATDGVTTTATATVTIATRLPSPPIALTDPAISPAAPAVGQTLTGTAATWLQPLTPSTASSSWQRCNASATTCVTVGGPSFIVRAADLGQYLRFASNSWNADGSVTRVTSVVGPVTDAGGPTASLVPTVSGSARAGGTLSAQVSWQSTQAMTIVWSWERCDAALTSCSTIAGATSNTYLAGAADVGSRLRFSSTATDARGSASVTAASSLVVPGTVQARLVARPVISGNTLTGETLGVTPSLLINGATGDSTELQWRRCAADGGECEDIAGATAGSYLLTAADHGSTIAVFQRTWLGGTYDWDVSPPSGEIRDPAEVGTMPPVNTTLPPATGAAQVSTWAYADTGEWNGVNPFTYGFQWLRCDTAGASCTPISGATSSSYLVTRAEATSTLRIQVTASNTDGASVAVSDATAPIPEPPPAATFPWSALAGTLVEGMPVTASLGTWQTVTAVSGTRYEFYRCPAFASMSSLDPSCTLLQDGPSATVTPDAASVDGDLLWRVHGTNAVGTGVSSWRGAGRVRPAPPVELTPVGTTGTAATGSVLTAAPATWSASRTVTSSFTWQGCAFDGTGCVDIGSGPVYTVRAQDEYRKIHVVEQARASGTNVTSDPATSTSASNLVPLQIPHRSGNPVVGGASLTVGATLTATSPSWTSPASFSAAVQWQQCDAAGGSCVDIAGATAATYVLAAADIDRRIRIDARATNAAGTASIASASYVVRPPLPTVDVAAPPTLSGDAFQGEQLGATVGGFTSQGATTTAWSWERCATTCGAIPGATASTYDLVAADVGMRVRARHTVTNAAGSASAVTADVVVLGRIPSVVGLPTVSGTAQVGATLTASSSWAAPSATTVTYSWLVCSSAVAATCAGVAGTGATLLVPAEAVGRFIRAAAQATSVDGSSAVARSGATSAVVGPPIVLTSPQIGGADTVGSTLGIGYSYAGTAPVATTRGWLRCDAAGASCIAIPGANGIWYTSTADDLGHVLRATLELANAYGTTSSTSAGLAVRPAPLPLPPQPPQPAVPTNDPPALPPAIGELRVSTPSASRVAMITWTLPAGAQDVRFAELEQRWGSATTAMSAVAALGQTTSTSMRLLVPAGFTSCIRARLVSGAGAGPWSSYRCATAPQAASRLRASRGWRAQVGGARSTTLRGATLTATSTQPITQVSVTARRCASCGSLAVLVAGRRVGTVDLRGRSGVVTRVVRLSTPRAGAVQLRVLSTRRLVHVHALALALRTP